MNTVYIINVFKITLQFTEYDASSNVKDFHINDRNDNFEAFEIKHILWPKNTPGSIHTAFCIIFTCLSNVKGRDKCVWKPGCRVKQIIYVEYEHQNALCM